MTIAVSVIIMSTDGIANTLVTSGSIEIASYFCWPLLYRAAVLRLLLSS